MAGASKADSHLANGRPCFQGNQSLACALDAHISMMIVFRQIRTDTVLASALSTYHCGVRKKTERFSTGNVAHVRMYRDMLAICSTARYADATVHPHGAH